MEGVPLLKEGRNSIYLWKIISQDSHKLTSPQVCAPTHPYLWLVRTTACRHFVRLSIESVGSSHNAPGRAGWGQIQLNFLSSAILELQCIVC